MKSLLFFLLILCVSGCATTQAPQGVDNFIFLHTTKKSAKTIIDDSNKSISFVESPAMKIDDNPYNMYSLVKFKDFEGKTRYRIIYKYAGIWTQRAHEVHTNAYLKTDLLMQEDVNGYVLETGALDLERAVIEACLEPGMKIVLSSRGNGTVFTPTPEMIKAMNRNDWDAVKTMQDKGEGHQSKGV